MRKTSELLQIMLNNVHLVKTTQGLCMLTENLYYVGKMEFEEWRILFCYISSNKPAYNIFNPWMLFNIYDAFWYIPGSIYPRKRWLKKHIKLCKLKGD